MGVVGFDDLDLGVRIAQLLPPDSQRFALQAFGLCVLICALLQVGQTTLVSRALLLKGRGRAQHVSWISFGISQHFFRRLVYLCDS